jgi:hypothetical protein
MAALVQAFSNISITATNPETETLKMLVIFCSAGLLVSVLFAVYGPAVDFSSLCQL